MRRNSGFSLLELMVALALGTLLTSVLLSVWTGLQKGQFELDQRLETLETVRISPVLLARLAAAAGNRQWLSGFTPLEPSGDHLEIQADIDGPRGLPDGMLEHEFESLVLRHRENQVQMRSGRSGFQPLLADISNLTWVSPSPNRLQFTISYASGSGPSRSTEMEIEIFLWNQRSNLFEESVH